MVDIQNQYLRIKDEIDAAIFGVLDSGQFIKGPIVEQFENQLADYLSCKHVVSCANGTDALKIALMALDLKPGDEVLTPGFGFAAAVEMISLLGFVPVLIDAEPDGFNLSVEDLERKITEKSRVILPLHLFGECTNMEPVMKLAEKHSLWVIEDNAQSIGAQAIFHDGSKHMAGTMGHIATLSFFPSKNLACYGDGGAVYTNDSKLAEKMRMIANHGSRTKYQHEMIGINSRLDAIQAAVLSVKLKYLGEYTSKRREVAAYYDQELSSLPHLTLPKKQDHSTHVYHQYTIVLDGNRDELKNSLAEHGIPSMVYYPKALSQQTAFDACFAPGSLPRAEKLSASVLSIPMHTEMSQSQLESVVTVIKEYIESKEKIEIQ